jgi:hypothetical protein
MFNAKDKRFAVMNRNKICSNTGREKGAGAIFIREKDLSASRFLPVPVFDFLSLVKKVVADSKKDQ